MVTHRISQRHHSLCVSLQRLNKRAAARGARPKSHSEMKVPMSTDTLRSKFNDDMGLGIHLVVLRKRMTRGWW